MSAGVILLLFWVQYRWWWRPLEQWYFPKYLSASLKASVGFKTDKRRIVYLVNPHTHKQLLALPSGAEAVFNHGLVDASSGASGTGQKAFGISDTGEYYRYTGANNVLHFSGIIEANKVPKEVRKQLQQQLKQRKEKQNQN